jgi:hypothetical protein
MSIGTMSRQLSNGSGAVMRTPELRSPSSSGRHPLRVTLDGQITEIIAFGNVVATGLEVWGDTVYLAQAGPIPHVPETGRVVAFGPQAATATWDGPYEGAPAQPETGALVRVNGDGTFTEVVGGLDRPTSLEIIKNTAYVVTIDGEIWTIDNIAGAPFGRP